MSHIVPGASLSLSPGILVVNGRLVDLDGQVYELNRLGLAICSIAESPIDIKNMITGLAELYGRDTTEIESDVMRFVIEMHHKGLVSIHQSFIVEVFASASMFFSGRSPALTRARTVLGRKDYFFRRYSSTVGQVVRGSVEAYQAVAWMAVILIAVAAGAEIASRPTPEVQFLAVRAILFWASFYFLSMLVSVVVHELAHLFAARLTGSLIYSIYVCRGVVGVSFKSRSPRSAFWIVLAGPAAGIATLLVSISFVLYAPVSFWVLGSLDQFRLPVITAVLCLVAWQLFGLTPLTTDGKAMRRALHQIRGRTR